MLMPQIVIAVAIFVQGTGFAEIREDVPCGACRNVMEFGTWALEHKFSIENYEMAPTRDNSQSSLTRRGRPEIPLAARSGYLRSDLRDVRPKDIKPMINSGLDDPVVTLDGGAYIVECSSDLGCHSGSYYGSCSSMHNDCLAMEAADFLQRYSSKVPSAAELSRALAAAPNSIRVNMSRSSIQIANCRGSVIANIPMAKSTLVLASMRAAVQTVGD